MSSSSSTTTPITARSATEFHPAAHKASEAPTVTTTSVKGSTLTPKLLLLTEQQHRQIENN